MNQGVVSFARVDPNWMVGVKPTAIVDTLPVARS
jgi:hypothetical protein